MLDKRVWQQASLEEARKLFDRRIKAKTNPERKSSRKYQLIDFSESMVIRPSHGKLDGVVQIGGRDGVADQQAAPNHRAYALQHHL